MEDAIRVDALLEAGLKERVRVVLQRGPVVEEKYLRVANYCRSMNQELDTIAHSCGCRHARELRREHVRIVESATRSEALSMLYPYPEAGSGRRAAVRVAS